MLLTDGETEDADTWPGEASPLKKRWVQSSSRLVGWLAGWFVGWLGGWLVGWLVGWLAGWLVGWLVGWLAFYINSDLFAGWSEGFGYVSWP